MKHISMTCVVAALLVTGCEKPSEQDAPQTSAVPALTGSPYEIAIANPARSDADRERDARSKPVEVLEFFGIEPGMHVLDMFSAGGYYSEILSYVVGPDGRVAAHNNEAYIEYVSDEAMTRYGNDRLANVEMLMAENNELSLEPATFDAVLLILAYHDVYYIDPENKWPEIDAAGLLAELYKGLKAGGVVGVVDHSAAAGTPRTSGNTLHRIDSAAVIEDFEAAGFVVDGQSDILRNSEDDLSLDMSDPIVRGKTDRFIIRFRKPADE